MSKISELVTRVRNHKDCIIYSPVTLNIKEGAPSDLLDFYSLCDGAILFRNSEYPLRIMRSSEITPANEFILGESHPEDISNNWFMLAEGGSEEYVTIDFSSEKKGWCYDSFHEVYAVAGSCAILAKSFSEFLERCILNDGRRYYWLQDDFVSKGDAYD